MYILELMKNDWTGKLDLFEYYNLSLCDFSIRGHLNNSKSIYFKIINFKIEFLGPKWFQVKNSSTTKLHISSKYYNFDLDRFSVRGTLNFF